MTSQAKILLNDMIERIKKQNDREKKFVDVNLECVQCLMSMRLVEGEKMRLCRALCVRARLINVECHSNQA